MGVQAKIEGHTFFDELRNIPEIAEQGRADIIFGPDMFDPRIIDGYSPLSDALRVAVENGELEDLGVPKDALDKTVGEVYGDIGTDEITGRGLEIARRLKPVPHVAPSRQSFFRRLLLR